MAQNAAEDLWIRSISKYTKYTGIKLSNKKNYDQLHAQLSLFRGMMELYGVAVALGI